jgi:hypothetical protein
MSIRGWFYRSCVAGWLIGFAPLAAGADLSGEAPMPVACSPEKPVVRSGGQVAVRAWASASEGALVRFFWTVEAGRVLGQGSEVSWDFAGVPQNPYPYQAKVHVFGPGGMRSDCTLRVFVASPDYGSREVLRGGQEVGRNWLLPDQTEDQGYGLYSYLLFGSRPEGESAKRYLQSIEAYLRLIPDLAALQKHFKPQELNVMSLPLLQPPSDPPAVTAEWVLANYDYSRARSLMKALPGTNRMGPYLVSSLVPLSQASVRREKYLFQDLSTVPPKLVSLWVREFLNQAAQQEIWQESTGAMLALRMRTTIGQVAIAFPEVQDALNRLGLPDISTLLKGWIAWKTPG